MRIEIKTLSVNECWQGKRFKTPAYKVYEKACLLLLKKESLPPPPYTIYIEFGFSNKASDIDNPLKPILDIIQKKYFINDKDIYSLRVEKVIVEKGKEYIEINIHQKTNTTIKFK